MTPHQPTKGHLLLETHRAGNAQRPGRWVVIAGADLAAFAGSEGRLRQFAALADLMTRMAERSHVSPEPTAFRITHHQPGEPDTTLIWAGQTGAPPALAARITEGQAPPADDFDVGVIDREGVTDRPLKAPPADRYETDAQRIARDENVSIHTARVRARQRDMAPPGELREQVEAAIKDNYWHEYRSATRLKDGRIMQPARHEQRPDLAADAVLAVFAERERLLRERIEALPWHQDNRAGFADRMKADVLAEIDRYA